MGVIYKLKPEIKEYILKAKQDNPVLSCRRMSALILDKFKLKLSKSSINALFKEADLSLPVGRRRKRKRHLAQGEGLGAVLLKAADYALGGSLAIAGAIRARLKMEDADLVEKTEGLIYAGCSASPAGRGPYLHPALEYITGKKIPASGLAAYLGALKENKAPCADISRIIPALFQEGRCLKLSAAKGAELFLDGQFYTVWSAPYTPYDFSSPLYSLKYYLGRWLRQGVPLVFCTAPGYDTPTREFLIFLSGMDNPDNRISKAAIYGNKLEELETMDWENSQRHFFIFGLWPWQFTAYRRVKRLGEFKGFTSAALKEDFLAADIELEITQPTLKVSLALRGCALKKEPGGKIRLIILANLKQEDLPPDKLAEIYLSRWPNLEEGFEDFSRKIELFTYTASSQRYCALGNLPENAGASGEDIEALLGYYLKALDLYVRWHILPAGYQDKDFAVTSERFYGLSAKFKKEEGRVYFNFQLPPGYSFSKDLEYACRRFNEKEVLLSNGERLCCGVAG